jgi:hypothetical protein
MKSHSNSSPSSSLAMPQIRAFVVMSSVLLLLAILGTGV